MTDTSGPSSPASSASFALQQSLASRLQARLAVGGGPLYKLTWKTWATGPQRSIYALRASAPRTSARGCTGWVTPSSRDWKDTPGMAISRPGHRRSWPDQLPRQAALAGWPTPQAFDATNEGKPKALRYKGSAPSEAGKTRNPNKPGSYRGDLKDWAAMALEPLASGQTPNGSPAAMAAGSRLNPDLPRWLMGFPREWLDECPQ